MQHWLREQLQHLASFGGRGHDDREPFLAAFRDVIGRIATCDSVTAAFGCHDGLLFEVAGHLPDPEALAAVTQASLVAAKETALTADLGRPVQMVIIGRDHKLALFPVGHAGQMALGIVAPATQNLARALSKRPPDKDSQPAMHRSILEEIGGRDAVEVVVAMFYERVLKDAELAPFFRGVSMARLQQVQTDFFVAALDGKPWRGRDLKAVHAGMAITDRQFDRTAQHLRGALEAAGAPAPQIEQIIALVATLRPQIVAATAAEVRRARQP